MRPPRPSSHRSLRVAALIRREITGLLRGKVKDPRLSGIEITNVEVSSDLSLAKIFLEAADGDDDAVLQGLNAAAGFLRRELAARLSLQSVPSLSFRIDESRRTGERIAQLIASEGEGD